MTTKPDTPGTIEILAKATPGPWKIMECDDGEGRSEISVIGNLDFAHVVCDVTAARDLGEKMERANAKLIATNLCCPLYRKL